jgi:PAS domain S-box-containing protein
VPHEDRAIACLNVASHTLDEVPDFARAALETIATQIGSAITRSKAREALRQSQANLQTLFDSLEDLLFVLDMEGHILDVNPVVLKRLGYSRAELAGEHVLKVHPPERHEEAAAIIADMVAGKTDSSPVPVMAKDGTQIPVETNITRGRWGGREAIFGISRDITERKEAERQVQLLGQIVRQMRDAVILTSGDRKSRIRYVNDAFSEIYGYNEDEVLGKPSWILFAGDEEERKRISAERREAIVRTGEGRLEYRDRRKDGSIFWVSNTLSVIDVEGTRYDLGIVRDITARKQAEEKLDSAVQELQVALAKVRTLSGLLPICANCNKIRDDQGYWQDVAVYVAQHSEAEFSHGICPDCKRELYPPEVYPFLYEDDE